MVPVSRSLMSYWLRQYGNAQGYQWQESQRDGKVVFRRPLGFVEISFDSDGRYSEGRADINNLIELRINTTLTENDFRERILLAWACLRCRHSLLRAKITQDRSVDSSSIALNGLHFQVDVLGNLQKARDNANEQIQFLDDYFQDVDAQDFYYHCQNSARVFDSEVSLSTLFVLPMTNLDGNQTLRLLMVGAHCIWDGLASYAWNRDFLQLLNDPLDVLKRKIQSAIRVENLVKSLPLPQEALYPPIPGSIARQRWFWAIVRILRHVRRPLQPGMPNPLLRRGPPAAPTPLPPTFAPVLPYSRLPVLTTQIFTSTIPLPAARRLHRICKETNVSIGAGCFALVALVGMELYESTAGGTGADGHRDFIAGFPLDARAFVSDASAPENMMLAFSDGIALPFLSASLDLGGRLRVLARRAHVQLGAYQKRKRELSAAQVRRGALTSRGAGLVLANQYLSSWERMERAWPGSRGTGVDVQGLYPLRKNPTMQTHGVSSVGRRDVLLRKGMYRLDEPGKDFVADFVDLKMSVRARDEEFLVAIGSFEDGIYVSASADVTKLDPELAEKWQTRIEHILDDLDDAEEAKL